MAARNELSLPELVAAGGILGTLIQTSRSNERARANAALQGQLGHLMRVLRDWQAAHQSLRATADRQGHRIVEQESEIESLRARVADLTARLAKTEAALGEAGSGASGAGSSRASATRKAAATRKKRGRK